MHMCTHISSLCAGPRSAVAYSTTLSHYLGTTGHELLLRGQCAYAALSRRIMITTLVNNTFWKAKRKKNVKG